MDAARLRQMEARAVERAHGIKTSHNLCLSCGHSIDAHDRQYGCVEDGAIVRRPRLKLKCARPSELRVDGSMRRQTSI